MQRSRPSAVVLESLETRCLLNATSHFGLRHPLPPELALGVHVQGGPAQVLDVPIHAAGQHHAKSSTIWDPRGDDDKSSRRGDSSDPEDQFSTEKRKQGRTTDDTHPADNGRPGDSDQGHGSGTVGGDQVSGKDGQGDSAPAAASTGGNSTTPDSHPPGGDTGHSGGPSGGSQDSNSG